MKLIFTTDHRFIQAGDGSIWTETNSGAALWRRYLEVFDEVRVVARLARHREPPAQALQLDIPGLRFAPVPDFRGPAEYLQRRGAVMRAVEWELDAAQDAALLLRLPSQFASMSIARWKGAYGIEVAGDPYDVFSPGAIRHPLRPFFRHLFAHRLRQQAKGAAVGLYVTHRALQRRYPTDGRSFAVSDVELPDEAFVEEGSRQEREGRLRLILVGSLGHLYKAPDVAIEALALCRARGLDLELCFVGDGRERGNLERLASKLEVRDRVIFRGNLPSGPAIREELDRADLFVLPSRQEGMPRAMLEAMARGLPVIGSRVGGVPELLDPRALVSVGDPAGLARTLANFAANPALRREQGARNLQVARGYRDANLNGIRRNFLLALRDVAAQGRKARQLATRRSAAA